MNLFPTPNPLRLRAVYWAAQYLMLRNDFTTVKEVVKLLKEKNYRANERNVSKMMQQLAEEDEWICNTREQYQFKEDSNEELSVSLRKNEEMFKVDVRGRKMTIYNWSKKRQETRTYSSNRKAIFHAEVLLKIKVTEGFYH